MPKRDIEEFIAHWSGATAPEQAISQQFLCELCDLLDVPQPGNQRNGGYTFEFHVRETQHDGSNREGRIDLYKRACFVLESKKFAEAQPEPSQLELSAVELGAATPSRRGGGPVRDTDRWDDAMLTDAEILERLVALNAERAAEEKRGVIHWLRPEYQSREQKPLNLTAKTDKATGKKPKATPAPRKTKLAWPKSMSERVQAVQTALHAVAGPITPGDLAKQFARAKPADVAEILKTLETLGRARRAEGGKFRA